MNILFCAMVKLHGLAYCRPIRGFQAGSKATGLFPFHGGLHFMVYDDNHQVTGELRNCTFVAHNVFYCYPYHYNSNYGGISAIVII